MKATISFTELQKIITENINQPISISRVDDKTMKVGYELSLGFIKKTIGVDLKFLDIVGSDVRISYSAGLGMDGVVSMALGMFKDKIPAGLLEEQDNHVLLLHLGSIPNIQPVFEKVDIKDLNLLAESIEVVGDFR